MQKPETLKLVTFQILLFVFFRFVDIRIKYVGFEIANGKATQKIKIDKYIPYFFVSLIKNKSRFICNNKKHDRVIKQIEKKETSTFDESIKNKFIVYYCP